MSKITPEMIGNYGLRYLNRYAPSISQYRQVLLRKVDRIIKEHGGNKEEARQLIEEEIEKRIAQKALDDSEYARVWVDHLHEKGKSKFAIIQKLKQKGIDQRIISQAISKVSSSNKEMQAAISYAKKRRFGPFGNSTAKNSKLRQKQIAAMMRTGHCYAHARKIIDAQEESELWDTEYDE